MADSPEDKELQRLLAFNENAQWVANVNCYGFALGVKLEERKVLPPGDVEPQPGHLSWRFRNPQITGKLAKPFDVLYLLLADGLIPVSLEEAATKPGHYIAAADHHFFRRVRPGLWVQKAGNTKITEGYGSQEKIVDINMALVEYATTYGPALIYGFFRVPNARLKIGARAPLPYTDEAKRHMEGILFDVWQDKDMRDAVLAEAKVLGLHEELDEHYQWMTKISPLRNNKRHRLVVPSCGR